ncbi:MAG TPA: serine/threonine-protein kinase [Polyangia bacterium]|nr:serine/threonine-protein kinase [Polyangia bacterium]
MSAEDQHVRTERVEHAGRSFRIRSQTLAERAQIATTLELGEKVLLSKAAPYNPTLDQEAVDRALEAENRLVRERLLAGDLDAWLEPGSASASMPPGSGLGGGSKPPGARRPGRWAVKVGMVETPFQPTEALLPRGAADGWETIAGESAPAAAPAAPAAAPAASAAAPAAAPAPTQDDQPKPHQTPVTLPVVRVPGSQPPPVRFLGPYRLLEDLGPACHLAVGGGGNSERLVRLRVVVGADARTIADARALLRVEHASLVPLLEAGVHGADLFCALPVVAGRAGDALTARCAELARPLPIDVAAWIVKETACALDVLHAGGRVHGALGLANVLLGWGGEVRLQGLCDAIDRQPRPSAGEDVTALGQLLYALLGRGQDGVASPARAPFVPPALLQIADRARGSGQSKEPLRSAHAVAAALTAYLAQDAPRTDSTRIARFLGELFATGERDDAERHAALLARAKAATDALPPPAPTKVLLASDDATSLERPPGTVVDGRYLVERLCGRGGMGLVYQAEHQGIGKRVALKILHPAFSRSHDIAERFRREARAATRIGHPHIVDVFDFGTTEDGCLYIAMEFLEGSDLGHLLDERGHLPIDRALRITVQICRALEAAHSAGIVHRDLKPENIFLCDRTDGSDFVKVLDFGIAKQVEEAPAQKLTRPNIALGTPEYMAPEQINGKTEPRSDLYAVGIMLYEMLCGQPPFMAENYLDVFRRKAVERPAAPSVQRPEVPLELDRVVLRALAQKPEHRQASMAALAIEIERLLASPREPVDPTLYD